MLYLNCDLPSVEDMVRDPQVLFRGCAKPFVVFDEIHQLHDPARVLKIGADGFPNLKILATGLQQALWRNRGAHLRANGDTTMNKYSGTSGTAEEQQDQGPGSVGS